MIIDGGRTALSVNIAQPVNSDYWRVPDPVQADTDGHQPGIYEILPYDETMMAAWIMQSSPSTLENMLDITDSYEKLSYGQPVGPGYIRREIGITGILLSGSKESRWIRVFRYLLNKYVRILV